MTENESATSDGDANARAWAGPALFAAVALAMVVFFWWFLS